MLIRPCDPSPVPRADMSSLIVFHRVLIGFGIAFCVGFAAWELAFWWASGSGGALGLGLVFLVLAAGLAFYLRHLQRFLGNEEGPASDA